MKEYWRESVGGGISFANNRLPLVSRYAPGTSNNLLKERKKLFLFFSSRLSSSKKKLNYNLVVVVVVVPVVGNQLINTLLLMSFFFFLFTGLFFHAPSDRVTKWSVGRSVGRRGGGFL